MLPFCESQTVRVTRAGRFLNSLLMEMYIEMSKTLLFSAKSTDQGPVTTQLSPPGGKGGRRGPHVLDLSNCHPP
jgi:hypothetical protein